MQTLGNLSHFSHKTEPHLATVWTGNLGAASQERRWPCHGGLQSVFVWWLSSDQEDQSEPCNSFSPKSSQGPNPLTLEDLMSVFCKKELGKEPLAGPPSIKVIHWGPAINEASIKANYYKSSPPTFVSVPTVVYFLLGSGIFSNCAARGRELLSGKHTIVEFLS